MPVSYSMNTIILMDNFLDKVTNFNSLGFQDELIQAG